VRFEDIDTLNRLALEARVDVVKVSMHAMAHLFPTYALLHSGGALGRGCGPLVVSRKDSPLRPAGDVHRVAGLADELARSRVALPGGLTTAAMLTELFTGGLERPVMMAFDRIMPAVAAGEVDAGVIIHEGRFTFGSYGLRRLVDLGEWWESSTGLPIPLGGIAVRRSLPSDVQAEADAAVRASLERAWAVPEEANAYARSYAQEMEAEVCAAHIELYVNEFSLDYGPEGEAAIRELMERAARQGLGAREQGLFWDET
jgi:1,4-dihydroxy-6-naphthoate synthase